MIKVKERSFERRRENLQKCLPQLKIETNRDVISRVLGAQISCSLARPNAL